MPYKVRVHREVAKTPERMYALVLGSFGWVKMVSVGQCSINQIEKAT
jgi:hypothetical protein